MLWAWTGWARREEEPACCTPVDVLLLLLLLLLCYFCRLLLLCPALLQNLRFLLPARAARPGWQNLRSLLLSAALPLCCRQPGNTTLPQLPPRGSCPLPPPLLPVPLPGLPKLPKLLLPWLPWLPLLLLLLLLFLLLQAPLLRLGQTLVLGPPLEPSMRTWKAPSMGTAGCCAAARWSPGRRVAPPRPRESTSWLTATRL